MVQVKTDFGGLHEKRPPEEFVIPKHRSRLNTRIQAEAQEDESDGGSDSDSDAC